MSPRSDTQSAADSILTAGGLLRHRFKRFAPILRNTTVHQVVVSAMMPFRREADEVADWLTFDDDA
jgi:hypothetical protein